MKKGRKTKIGKGGGENSEGLDFREIEKLLDLMARRGVEEFELEKAGQRVRVRREVSGSPTQQSRAGRESRAANPVMTDPLPAAASGAATEVEEIEPARPLVAEQDLTMVKSPIVGTFYEAPAPGAPPFVQVGTQVQAGQVLCIIEAMKLMNEIESEVPGEIVKIFVQNGQPVEYSEPLFAIRPLKRK